MRIPGYTAQASLYRNGNPYRLNGYYRIGEAEVVVPAQNWGAIGDYGCTSTGIRRFSAILWNIPWGQSWEKACAATPGPAGSPVAGALPTRCVNTWSNIWGEWDVSDPKCCPPGYAQTKKTCPFGGAIGLWCRDYCGPPEGNRPISGWYFCGICIGGEF